MKNREILTQMLARVHPELDLSDEDVLFGLIFDDYEHYASLLAGSDSDPAPRPPKGGENPGPPEGGGLPMNNDHDSDHDAIPQDERPAPIMGAEATNMEVGAFSRTSLEQLRVLPPLDRRPSAPITDGLPALGGGGNPRRAAPGSSIFDLARGA